MDLLLSQENFDSGTVSINSSDRFIRLPEKIFQKITFQKTIKYQIEQKTLDSVIKNTNIDLLKVDVEGFELNCLEGASNTISAQLPDIIIEVFEETYDECARFLKDFGYQFFSLSIDKDKELIIKHIDSTPNGRLNALASKKELSELMALTND